MTIPHSPPSVFSIEVNGEDLSDKFNKYLIKVSVVLNSMITPDTAEITLDDTNGQLAIPPQLGTVKIGPGWQETGPIEVFNGFVDETFSQASR